MARALHSSACARPPTLRACSACCHASSLCGSGMPAACMLSFSADCSSAGTVTWREEERGAGNWST